MLAILGGVPGAVLGGLVSRAVSGTYLLILSGVMLLFVGARVLMPDPEGHQARCEARRDRNGLILAATFAVGLLTGLLANGGGFLLVPLFVVVLGLTTGKAAGTSMVTVGVLIIPTLVTHWALGHIDWRIAIAFAVGVFPASLLGARIAQVVPPRRARLAFGMLLVVFAVGFLIRQLA
jgi:uncharacterized membrane protein YfcA